MLCFASRCKIVPSKNQKYKCSELRFPETQQKARTWIISPERFWNIIDSLHHKVTLLSWSHMDSLQSHETRQYNWNHEQAKFLNRWISEVYDKITCGNLKRTYLIKRLHWSFKDNFHVTADRWKWDKNFARSLRWKHHKDEIDSQLPVVDMHGFFFPKIFQLQQQYQSKHYLTLFTYLWLK